MSQQGIVAIGRNEGERLRLCLESAAGRGHAVVYVDSGSSDGSVELARSMGVDVVELDLTRPFTAARARNEGFARLEEISPDIQFVQFVDSDCVIAAGWLDNGRRMLDERPAVAAVAGRRREHHPEQSMYNRIADIEWNSPIGEAKYFGGDVLVRADAFRQAGGYNPTLIAGEDPDLSIRIRQRGWTLLRIDAEMTLHDIAMTRFSQWWKRSDRGGFAFAQGVAMHGRPPERHWVHELRSTILWGILLPLFILVLAWPTYGASFLLTLAYPLQAFRIARRQRKLGMSPDNARLWGWNCILCRFPNAMGALRYWFSRLSGRHQTLIEYKESLPTPTHSRPDSDENRAIHPPDPQSAPGPQRPAYNLAIAATFTAEPVEDALSFWMEELGFSGSVEFAPYNQIFQQLLDPGSVLAHNREGVNIVLIRLEDWQRSHVGLPGPEDAEGHLARNAADLIDAVRTAMARSKTPLILGFCPDSPAALAEPDTRDLFARIREQITAALREVPSLCLIGPDDLNQYPVEVYYDPQRDQLGHIPYTPLFYTAVGTILARRVHALTSVAYKVIVLDCDNTLWKGVVGEEGAAGITIPPAWSRLQQFMVEQANKGVLLCLCSKNDESDVLDVFEQRPEMVLKRDHLVAWRINWRPKSENIRALAQELNLGLDSFIFLDDNPVECAEVRAGCPEVLTLRLPIEGDIAGFIEHVWAFDRLSVTSEDQQRTAMYKQEIDRGRFRKQAMTIEEFLAGLNLQITISEPSPMQISRVAQLTQRTNQFNFTTVRRNDGEILHLSESGLECRVVEVSDRFGDYGLVGVMIFGARGDSLEVDTFLLSCRVLGRGVEHRMVNELGKIAEQRSVSLVNATVISTRKNLPARQFLDRVFADFRHEIDGGWRYCVPSESAATVAYTSEAAQPEAEMAPVPAATLAASSSPDPEAKSRRFERIATGLALPSQVFERLQARVQRRRPRPAVGHPFLAPRNEVEAALAEIWAILLRFEQVSVQDNFFNLGGTSLLAVDLFTQIEHRFGKKLPLTVLIQAPTLEKLARLLTDTTSRESLVLMRDGGDKPPLFLVHDGDGETMLYRNLALLLKPDHAVFGLQPHSQEHVPITHTRIEEMAAYHIDRIRSIQSRGPYLVGGMCAGGVIAFEIARQLQSQGEKVGLVALIDAADVAATPKSWRFASQRIQSFSTAFRQDESVRIDRRALMMLTKALRKTKNLTMYLVRQRFTELRDEIRMRLFRSYLSRGLRLPRSLEQIPVRTVYLFAEKNYQVGAPFDGELVLFRATRGEGPDEPYIERYDDPLLGWGKRATGGVRVFDVPGGHSSMLQEPNVPMLAEQMQAAINEALADESRPPSRGGGQLTPFEPALAGT